MHALAKIAGSLSMTLDTMVSGQRFQNGMMGFQPTPKLYARGGKRSTGHLQGLLKQGNVNTACLFGVQCRHQARFDLTRYWRLGEYQ
jgi:hypothetical protein